MKLLTPAFANTKLAKGGELHNLYLSYILHLAPGRLSGFNVCPGASKGCLDACLNTAGRGAFNSIQQARINKTKRFFNDRDNFMLDLFKDLEAVLRKAKRENKTAVVRLNGTSDIDWTRIKLEGFNLFELFPEIQFYDYTKVTSRLELNQHSNYHLTFSRSEVNETRALDLLAKGFNVAIVFKTLPDQYKGFNVVAGDSHDFRFLDPKGFVVGLTAKGKAKRDSSGFVV